jgi:toxin ParE1/3/4
MGQPQFRVTPRAAKDLRAIASYTLRAWGRKQRDAYLRGLDRRFAWLAEHPYLGKPRPDIKDGYHSYPQGSHVIFYLVCEAGIDIIGVLHQRMDVLTYFEQAQR